MEIKDILSSAQAQQKIDELKTRKNEIVDSVSEKRTAFEEADVETRDAILAEVEQLEGEVPTIDADIAQLEEVRAKFEDQEQRMSIFGQITKEKIEERAKTMEQEKNIFDTPEYRKAWVESIISGDDKEVRALTTGTEGANNGGVVVPTIMQQMIETAWEKYGKFSKLVNKTYAKGLLSIPFEKDADDAVWHAEGAAAPAEENITLETLLLAPRMIKKWISITDELKSLAPEEFMRYLSEELVYKVVNKLDHEIIVGEGADGKGVIGIAKNEHTVEIKTAKVEFNVVNSAIAQLKTFDNLTVAMNPATFFNSFMGLKDTTGRPIYNIANDNTGKPQYFVNGIRVEFTDALKAYDAATTGDVWAVVGNFDGYRLNMPNGESVQILNDPYTLAREDKEIMVAKLFVAGNVTKLGYFASLSK